MRSLTLPHGYHKPQPIGGRRLLTMSGVVIGGGLPAPTAPTRGHTIPGLSLWSSEPIAQHGAGCVAANAELFEADTAPARSLVTQGRLFGALIAIAIAIAIGLASLAYHQWSAPAPPAPTVLVADAMRHGAEPAAREKSSELRRATGALLALFPLGLYVIHITTRCAESAARS
jgi:hypothetical protein